MALVAAAALTACATAQKPKEKAEPVEAYRIGPEDVVEVSVFQAPELSRTVPVRPDGKISLPLLGDVMAAGRTATEMAEKLRSRFATYVQSPKVTVIVREVNAPRVYVIGEVGHPGAFPIRGTLNVVQALAMAGGLGDFASRGSIVLIRKGPNGDQRITLDYDDLVEDDDATIPRLKPGDTIYVP